MEAALSDRAHSTATRLQLVEPHIAWHGQLRSLEDSMKIACRWNRPTADDSSLKGENALLADRNWLHFPVYQDAANILDNCGEQVP